MASAGLSGIDTSAVTDMNLMFYGCTSLASLNSSGWDTSAVGDMRSMFDGCASLAKIVGGGRLRILRAFPGPADGAH